MSPKKPKAQFEKFLAKAKEIGATDTEKFERDFKKIVPPRPKKKPKG